MSDEFDQYQSERPTYAERQAARQRRQARTRKIVVGVSLLAVSVLVLDVILEEGFNCYLLFRSREQWNMLTFRNDADGEIYSAVYYTGYVQKADAERVRDYFQKAGLFAVPHTISVVLSRTGEGYVVSFFIAADHFHDAELIAELNQHRRRMSSELFGGHPVIVQMCERNVIPTGTYPRLVVVRVLRD
jgi:hypothetical protein